jgi:hypothetical protein
MLFVRKDEQFRDTYTHACAIFLINMNLRLTLLFQIISRVIQPIMVTNIFTPEYGPISIFWEIAGIFFNCI